MESIQATFASYFLVLLYTCREGPARFLFSICRRIMHRPDEKTARELSGWLSIPILSIHWKQSGRLPRRPLQVSGLMCDAILLNRQCILTFPDRPSVCAPFAPLPSGFCMSENFVEVDGKWEKKAVKFNFSWFVDR